MARYAGNKSAGAANGSSQVWAGIFVGMVIGAGMAAVLTWYMMRSPSPYLPKEPVVAMPQPETVTTSPSATTQSGADKPRFEFYNVLTDKQAQKGATPSKPSAQDKSGVSQAKPAEPKSATAYTPQILQVGSFSSNADAEKLRARLALIGAESHIQIAKVEGKGVYYRVRLGPYKSEEELNNARNFLKQNDLESTPMRAK